MKKTREKILRTLLTHPNSAIKDLAEAVGINSISIRHHLTALEAENLITSAEERHGVGRPRLIYSLTEKGVEQFPTSYLRLTHRLLATLKNTLPEDQFLNIFHNIGKEIVEKYDFDSENETYEDRLNTIKKTLTNEGFIVDWKKKENVFYLTSLSCPYSKIGLDHPEVCKIDHAIISSFFSQPVTIKTCISNGDDRCIYEIPPNKTKEETYE